MVEAGGRRFGAAWGFLFSKDSVVFCLKKKQTEFQSGMVVFLIGERGGKK